MLPSTLYSSLDLHLLCSQRHADLLCTPFSSIGYAGPVSVSDAIPASNVSGQVIHGPLDVATVPVWVGTSQIRNYTVYDQDDAVFLRIQSPRPGGIAVLWWEKKPSRT